MYLFESLFSFYALLYSILVNLVIFFCASISKSKLTLWCLAIGLMGLSNLNKFELFMSTKINIIRNDAFVEFMAIFYFMILRLIGFCLDKIDANKAKHEVSSEFSLINLISYSFYPSFLFVSAFIPYKNFKEKEL